MPLFWRKNTNQFIVSTKTISCKLAAQNKRAVKAKSERVTLHSHLLWRCPMGLTRGTKYQTVKVSWSWGLMSSLLISWSWRNMAVYVILAKWHWLTHSVAAVANTPIEKQIEMPCNKCRYPSITTVPSNNLKYKFREQQEPRGGPAIYLTCSLNSMTWLVRLFKLS